MARPDMDTRGTGVAGRRGMHRRSSAGRASIDGAGQTRTAVRDGLSRPGALCREMDKVDNARATSAWTTGRGDHLTVRSARCDPPLCDLSH